MVGNDFFKAKKTGKMNKGWQIYYIKSKLCVTLNYASIKNRRLKKVQIVSGKNKIYFKKAPLNKNIEVHANAINNKFSEKGL